MQLPQVLALCISITASVQCAAIPGHDLAAVNTSPRNAFVTEADLQLHILEKREMSDCGDRWDPPPGVPAPQHVIDDAGYCLNNPGKCEKYAPGWKHPVCGYQYENCVRLGAGVTMRKGAFNVRGHWYGQDGTQLLAFHYWQQQVEFIGANADGKVYLAHGNTWTCTKGLMNAYLEDDNFTLAGNSPRYHNKFWGGPCKCFYKLNTDMMFYLRGKKP